MYRDPKNYYVYIMTNRSRTLYTGSTSKLEKRAWQHKNGVYEGFTSRYKIDRLVYFERWANPGSMVRPERQIKGMKRSKKMALIVSMNPEWRDLSEEWGKPIEPLKPKSIDASSG